MKKNYLPPFLVLLLLAGSLFAQTEISLPTPMPSAASKWTQAERQYFSESWKTNVVTNVSKPALLAYLPKPEKANGMAVVICPGGGFWALSIDSEGIDVAKWLADNGVAAFVLKYRLVPSKTNEAVKEMSPLLFGNIKDGRYEEASYPYIPLAVSDGTTAIDFIRQNAAKFRVSPNKIGIIGFSAGGTVAANAAINYTPASRPNFAAPIYPVLGMIKDTKLPRISGLRDAQVPADAPPLFVVVATNDGLGLAPDSVDLYKKWLTAKKIAEIHVFSKGGHGFGMRKQNLPSDNWPGLFLNFLNQEIGKQK